MSENITHTAVTDDCARLALHSGAICEPFKHCLREHLDIARLGAVTRSGDRFTDRLLAKFRDEWPGPAGGSLLGQKLAFVLGWLCHRAADRQMKPVFASADPDCPLSPTDCSIYHDVFLFREVYANGRNEPYSPATLQAGLGSLPASKAFSVAEVEDLFRCLWQRALIGLHTFIPDRDDIEGWLERLFSVRQVFEADIRRYAEAYANPDPAKVKRFVTDVNFYHPADPIIRRARSIQQGRPDEAIDMRRALDAVGSQSHYAQALRKGYLYLQAASDFFEHRIDDAMLRVRLDIGNPGG